MLLVLPGDSDGDMDVDGADFLQWQHGQGMATGALSIDGDLDGDGDVDQYDEWIIRNNLGVTSAASGQIPFLQIPEPTSSILSLLTLAFTLLASRIHGSDKFAGNRFNLTIVPSREILRGRCHCDYYNCDHYNA